MAHVVSGLSRRISLIIGIIYFSVESAQSVLLLPLLRHYSGAGIAGEWAVLTAAIPLVNLAYAGYAGLLVVAISRANSEDGRLGCVGSALRRAFVDSSLVLLACQGLYFSYVSSSNIGNNLQALGLIFLASQLRLYSLNAYIALNGVRCVGIDKTILLLTSSATALASLYLARHGATLDRLATAVLIFAAAQAILATGALHRLLSKRSRSASEVKPISRRLVAAVWMSQIGGFLNLAAEIPTARAMLNAGQLADFAFYSRAFQTPLAIVGLWCQISTPFWARADDHKNLNAPLIALRKPALTLGGLYFILVLLYFYPGNTLLDWIGFNTRLPPIAPLMLLDYLLAAWVVMIGSYLIATGTTAHLVGASLIGSTAPLSAWAWNQAVGANYFYIGFLQTNALLLVYHFFILKSSQEKTE